MKSLLFRCVALALVLAGCASLQAAPGPGPAASGSANLPNPASVYCKEHGGTLQIRTDATGAQSGACVFADASECDEWAYFRAECAPGQQAAMPADTPGPALGQMTEEQARAIASATDSACAQVGQLEEKAVFNPNSRTWWIDLAAAPDTNCPGGNAACVVSEDGTTEVNWRCTGAVEPTEPAKRP